MEHNVYFTEECKLQLQSLSEEAQKKLFKHFVQPIKNGLTPSELEGKYKPSWEMEFIKTQMQQAFVQQAKAEKLFHYHFGFRYYKDGKDPKYGGKVSDGIVHIKQNEFSNPQVTEHIVFDVCLEHPSPFKVPFLKDKTKAA
ncbi:hypothetical protein [Shewanella sp. HL-SH2]|uniref:hypothetical protein n=1 Tax=Shewanella sp. HL-SH2 TaxID=3436238 RepID=UPI003EBF12A7